MLQRRPSREEKVKVVDVIVCTSIPALLFARSFCFLTGKDQGIDARGAQFDRY